MTEDRDLYESTEFAFWYECGECGFTTQDEQRLAKHFDMHYSGFAATEMVRDWD